MESLFGYMSGINFSTLSIPTIRLSDIIDMTLAAFLIYYVMKWIKQTRAWFLLKGVVIILVISILSYQFHFYTISLVIQKTLSVGIIAIIVLFQPEFRKALEQLGKSSESFANIFRPEDELKEKQRVIDEIICACFKMAKVKTGALILIEQDVPLGDFNESGIKIDAIVSNQLLINIFENKTPLHDGAVLIRQNRVAAATCILPLTSTEIGLELGTRHRAAVGASEVSDAYAIVVSEETGAVSVAYGGKLYKNLNEAKLRNMLISEENRTSHKISLWKDKKKNGKKKSKRNS
ncbi:MAG: diadenylate cyclase CdaA [Firmicutes bacterium]|nr:diadenylate cyclase CdaA [Bacillota bacterium]